MTDLVVSKDGGVMADSRIIAQKFDKRHAYVVRAIETLMADFDKLRVTSDHPKIIKKIDEYRGQKFEYYEMDKKFFARLAMRFKGKRAFEWQGRFIDAFFEMERVIAQQRLNEQSEVYQIGRAQSKLVRREETDVIKQFVEYATGQGSTQAKFYYKHLTTATYKCLGLIQFEKPKLRETLDIMQLNQLILAEVVAKKSLLRYMEEGEHYKTIFTLVKQDLENFADAFLMTPHSRPNLHLPVPQI